jgi:hypothetical protein
MLRKNDRYYLTVERPRYIGKSKPPKIRKRDFDIRKKVKEGIEDLIFLSKTLEPEQHREIFNSETITPLVKELFVEYPKKWIFTKEDKKISELTILDERLFKLAMETAAFGLHSAKTLVGKDYMLRLGRGVPLMFPRESEMDMLRSFYWYLPKERKT